MPGVKHGWVPLKTGSTSLVVSINQSIGHVQLHLQCWRSLEELSKQNKASSHYAVLDSSIINCSIYFQIISISFPWYSPRSLSQHIFTNNFFTILSSVISSTSSLTTLSSFFYTLDTTAACPNLDLMSTFLTLSNIVTPSTLLKHLISRACILLLCLSSKVSLVVARRNNHTYTP